MKLYEINERIVDVLSKIEIDEETGETVADDAIFDELQQLEMERGEVLSYLAKELLNRRAEIEMIKAEEARLKEHRELLAKKSERIMKILERECGGQNTDLGVATVKYRKTSRVMIPDEEAAITWLEKNNHEECLRYKCSISLDAVKKMIASGTPVPVAEIVQSVSCSVK